jgi:hypothetical protein
MNARCYTAGALATCCTGSFFFLRICITYYLRDGCCVLNMSVCVCVCVCEREREGEREREKRRE